MSLDTTVQCVGCGGPLDSMSSVIPAVMACSCHVRGSSVTDRIRAHGGYCGDACRNHQARRGVARRRKCSACGVQFDDGHIDPTTGAVRPGRPSVYCSDECRTGTERARTLAMKELAKSKFGYRNRDDCAEAADRAVDLLEFWCGRAASKPIEPAPGDAKNALRERIAKLREELEAFDRAAWDDHQRQLDKRRKESWAADIEARAKADRAWREKLLA